MFCGVKFQLKNQQTYLCPCYYLPQQAKQSTGYGKDPSRHIPRQSIVGRGGKSSKQDKKHTL